MDYETPTCIKCECEWAGDYPVCMLCAPDTHFPNRPDCIHCEMLADLQSKDRAFELMREALEMLARHRINHLEREGDDGLAREELTIIQAAIAAAKGE